MCRMDGDDDVSNLLNFMVSGDYVRVNLNLSIN